jgi:hypothetical protein
LNLNEYLLTCLLRSAIAHGLGRHGAALTQNELITFFIILFAFEAVYVTTVLFIKLSILQMYLRIFPSRDFRTGIVIIAAVVVAWWVAIMLCIVFQCNPISKAWVFMEDGKCINVKGLHIGNAIPNLMTDVVMLLMAMSQLWTLQIAFTQKLQLCFIFSLGGF